MNKFAFGHLWWGATILSGVLAELWLGFWRGFVDLMNVDQAHLTLMAGGLTYFLCALVYYWYVLKLIDTRVSKITYVIFLLGGIVLLSTSVFKAYGLYSFVYSLSPADVPVKQTLILNIAIPFLIAFVPSKYLYWRKGASEGLAHRRLHYVGRGGSAIWASVATFRRFPARLKQSLLSFAGASDEGVLTNRIFIGRSLLDDTPFPSYVGIKDNSHFIYCAGTRTGKSVSHIYNIAASYKRDAIIIDPKGELAKQTLFRRSSKACLAGYGITGYKTNKHFEYGETIVLDPFGITGFKSRFYDPLGELDPNDPNCGEYLDAIIDGMVRSESKDNQFFEDYARSVLRGFIVQRLTRFSKRFHNLPAVLDLLYGIDENGNANEMLFDETLLDMLTNNAMDGAAQQAAQDLRGSSDDQRGAIMASVTRAIKWAGDPAMRKHLSGTSNFSFKNIGIKTFIGADGKKHDVIQTVYIVLPDTRMKTMDRWLRTLLAVGTVSMQRRSPLPKESTLLLIDEFPKLGNIKTISQGYGLLAGYKIQLSCFIQDIPQLKKAYPEWETFFANSNAIFFGVSDTVTAEYISKRLGKVLKTRRAYDGSIIDGATIKNEHGVDLLDPEEVMRLLSKESNMQIVFGTSGYPMRLERLTFKPIRITEGGQVFNALGLDGFKGHFEDY